MRVVAAQEQPRADQLDCHVDMATPWDAVQARIDGERSTKGPDIDCRAVIDGLDAVPDDGYAQLLAGAGVRRCAIESHVELDLGDDEGFVAARFVAWLRACLSLGISVAWDGSVGSGLSAGDLVHLPPPAGGPSANDAARWWAGRHRYGQFYWRSGPGFVMVKDVRPDRQHVRLTVDDQTMFAAFHRLHTPARRRDAEAAYPAQVLADLLREGVVLRLGEWLVTAPGRMTRWPIPFGAI